MNIEIDYNFWDYMAPETVTFIARIFKEGYTVPNFLETW